MAPSVGRFASPARGIFWRSSLLSIVVLAQLQEYVNFNVSGHGSLMRKEGSLLWTRLQKDSVVLSDPPAVLTQHCYWRLSDVGQSRQFFLHGTCKRSPDIFRGHPDSCRLETRVRPTHKRAASEASNCPLQRSTPPEHGWLHCLLS